MKKLSVLILTAIILISSAGCSKAESNSTPSSESSTASVAENSESSSSEQQSTAEKPETTPTESQNTEPVGYKFSELLEQNADFKAALTDAANDVDSSFPEESKPDYSSGKSGDLDPQFAAPYNASYYAAYSTINGYAIRYDVITDEQHNEWCAELNGKLRKDPTNLDNYYDPWGLVHRFNLKYDDFIGEFIRVRGLDESAGVALTDDEIRIIFEGTKQDIIDTFLSEYTIYKNGKVYTPLIYTGKMSLKELINDGITPDMLQSKVSAINKDYGDQESRYWVKDVTSRFNIYSKLCTDVYESVKKSEKFDVDRWIAENVKE